MRQRKSSGLSAGFALALWSAGTSGPALADGDGIFNDCMDAGYLAFFPDAPSARELTCVEHFRFSVATPGGARWIRGISDAAADWAAPPALVAEVERGARLAGSAFGGLGRFSVDTITILLLDDVRATGELDPGATDQTLGVTLSDPVRVPECLITIYALSPAGDDGSMATTVAHEIFHCVQGATYAGPKYQSYGDGGAWWIEGAAEAFAAAAIPESAVHTDRSGDFDAAVEARIALNDMAHQSVLFFYWLMQARGGLAALMPFQDAMAGTGGAEAQQAAMRAALPPEDWARFAQAYADSTIRHPQGGGLASSPADGTVMTFDATGRRTLPLAPFTISLGRAYFGCGVWGTTVAPGAPELSFRGDDGAAGADWRALPDDLDTREGADTVWRMVAIPTDNSPAEGEINSERRQGCTPCLGTSAVDACLVGTWAMTGGGPAEWMAAQGFPATLDTSGTEAMTLRADGGFVTGAFDVSLDGGRNGLTVEGDGSVPAATGTWSAEGGRLNFCAEAGGGMTGRMTVTTEESTSTSAMGVPGGGSISMGYSCTGAVLVTTLPMRGLPDMTTTYQKVAE